MCGCDKEALHTGDAEFLDQYIFIDADIAATKGSLISGKLPSAANTSFGVLGYRGSQNKPVFDMYSNNIAKLYRPQANALFKYDQLALWTAGESHSFYAYYPYGPNTIITGVGNDNGTPYITYSQPENLGDMVDVMTAKVPDTNAAEHTTTPVTFNFEHRLFAISLNVVNAQESKQPVIISEATIEFENVNTTARFNIDEHNTYTSSAPTKISHDYTFDPVTLSIPDNETSVSHNLNDGNEFLFIPCSSLKVNISLKLKNAWGQELPTYTINESITPEGGFVAGKRYQMIVTKIDKEDNGIQFSCKVTTGWTSVDIPTSFQ